MSKNVFCILFLIPFSIKFNAQVIDFDSEYIEEDLSSNLQIYSEQYIGNVLDAYGINKVSAWSRTARTLNPYGFSFGFFTSATSVWGNDIEFNFTQQNFSNQFRLKDPSDPNVPTLLGGETDQVMVYSIPEQKTGASYPLEFPAPSGIDVYNNLVPTATLTLNLGLEYDLEFMSRLFWGPTTYGVNHVEVGLGLKHMISRYFLDPDAAFQMSICLMSNYSSYTYDIGGYIDGSDQELLLRDISTASELIASYDYKFLTFIGSVGYYFGNSIFQMNGTYRYQVEEVDPVLGVPVVYEAFELKDPISIDQNKSRVRASVGASVRPFRFTECSLIYSFSKYNNLALHLAFLINNGKKKQE